MTARCHIRRMVQCDSYIFHTYTQKSIHQHETWHTHKHNHTSARTRSLKISFGICTTWTKEMTNRFSFYSFKICIIFSHCCCCFIVFACECVLFIIFFCYHILFDSNHMIEIHAGEKNGIETFMCITMEHTLQTYTSYSK